MAATDVPLDKLRATPYLAELIETGQSIGLDDVNHKYFKQFAYYEVIFKLGDKWYAGVLNIGIHKDDTSSLYDLNPFAKIEKAGPPSQESTIQAKNPITWKKDPASKDNITDLSEKVNT